MPARDSRHFNLRLRGLFALAALLILLLAVAAVIAARQYNQYQHWVLHSYQVRQRITDAHLDIRVAESEARAYAMTGREAFVDRYYASVADTRRDLDGLHTIVSDNPQQTARATTLANNIGLRLQALQKIVIDYRSRGAEAARADVVVLLNETEKDRPISETTTQMLDAEAALLDARQSAFARSGRVLGVIAAIAVAGSLLLILAAFVMITIEQRRRLESEQRLAAGAREIERALGESRQLADTLRRLSLFGEMLQSCRERDEAIAVMERALPPLLPEMSGCLALINPSHNFVEARMHWGVRGPDLAAAVFPPDDCWALRRSQPHPGFGDIDAPACKHLVHGGVTAGHTLCLPLSAQGQALGVLSLVSDYEFDPGSRELLLTLGDQLALALANLELQQNLRSQSIRDPLTGLFNRRYLEASLPRELVRAERRGSGLAVLMLDLDHFKGFNDGHGHDAGDALLADFGALLGRISRGDDIPCRYGGEEFVLVLVDIDPAHARARAEAIRAATAELAVRHRGTMLPPPTVSIGIAVYPDSGHAPAELLRAADQALYRAKREGRNRVVAA